MKVEIEIPGLIEAIDRATKAIVEAVGGKAKETTAPTMGDLFEQAEKPRTRKRHGYKPRQREFCRVDNIARKVQAMTGKDRDEIRGIIYKNYGHLVIRYDGHNAMRSADTDFVIRKLTENK